MIISNCKFCGADKVDRIKRIFCSKDCRYKNQSGKPPWNKGKKLPKLNGNTNGFKKGHKTWNKGVTGHKFPKEVGIKISAKLQGIRVEDWVGYKTEFIHRLRMSTEYKLWRTAVFERDNWTCQECSIRGKKGLGRRVVLNADHIKPFALFPELRFELTNGRTLCVECHRKTKTYGINAKKEIYQS